MFCISHYVLRSTHYLLCVTTQTKIKFGRKHLVYRLLLLLVFSPWAGLGRDQSSVRRLVWLWYAASWASS